MGFVFGILIGFIIGFIVSALEGRKKLKKEVADAETRGIEQGATLEAEIGWKKSKKKK